MESAAFDLDGDSTKFVASMYRCEEAIKRTKKEMRSWQSDTKSDAFVVYAAMDRLSQIMAKLSAEQKTYKDALKATGEAQKAIIVPAVVNTLKATSTSLVTATQSSGQYRQAMNSIGFAINDALSVHLSFVEVMRAVSNNLQMLALAIPGPWGMVINVATLAVQAWSVFSMTSKNATDELKKNAAAAMTTGQAFAFLRDEVDKATMAEEAYARAQKEGKLNEAIQAAKKQLKEATKEEQDARRNTLEAAGHEFAAAQIGAADPFRAGGNLAAQLTKKTVGQMFGAESAEESRRAAAEATEARTGAQATLEKAQTMRESVMEGYDRRQMERAAERLLSPANDDMKRTFAAMMAREGEPQARRALTERTAGMLPQNLRGAAPAEADRIARSVLTDIEGKRIAEQAKTPAQRAIEAKEEEAKRLRFDANVARDEAQASGGRFTTQEKKAVAKLDALADASENAANKLKMMFEAEEKGRNAKFLSGPAIPVPRAQNRNGNL